MKGLSIKKTLDINYNLDYLVIVPKKSIRYLDAFTYTFGNTLLFENNISELEFLMKFLRKNTVGRLVFVDYYVEYDEIINTLVEEHDIDFVFTGHLGELSDSLLLQEFNVICGKYDSKMIDSIAFLDHSLFRAVHDKRRNTHYILLDVVSSCGKMSKIKKTEDRDVGLLNLDASNYDSFYNQLCGAALLPDFSVKVYDPSVVTKSFLSEFGIQSNNVENYDELFIGNYCNMYVNFTGTNSLVFIRSMDCGTPCLVGNNDFLSKDYPILYESLVLKSDDDVNEIASKTQNIAFRYDDIMKEYKDFRASYSCRAKELASKFLPECETVADIKNDNQEVLLSVIVPVYNTEQFLAKCLDSIIEARIDDMEVLVINDGSTDNSRKIAREYEKKYPDLISYYEQENRGLGNVRNVGLMRARGKYLASVDSDDTIQSDFFRDALPFMQEDVDVIVCDWMSIADDKRFETVAVDWVFEKRKTMEGLLFTTIMPSTCNKIMKRKILLDNKVKYLEQKYEDLSANPQVLLCAETVKYLRKPYYNYHLRSNSLMRSKVNPREMVDALVYLDNVVAKKHRSINIEEFKYYTYSWRIEEYIINPLYDLEGEELDREIKYIYENIHDLVRDVFKSEFYKKMLDKLKSDELKTFIKERNAAFCKKRLKQFIIKTKSHHKLTAGVIYYGD